MFVQATREVCTTVSVQPATESTPSSESTVMFPPQAHARHSSIPSTPPPCYQSPAAVQHHTVDIDDDATAAPPDYTKFPETTRAERCFYYGFLFCPIWIFGLMHFWAAFSSTPQTIPLEESAFPHWIDSSTGLPIYSSPSPSTPPASPSTPPASPSQKKFTWRRTSSSSKTSTPRQSSPSTVLEMNRPDLYSAWRKEERKWALRSGYAMTASWALLIMFLFICFQTGVFGISFSS